MPSVKETILSFLEKRDFTPAGIIEDYIRQTAGHSKASTTSRRCRELENEGKLETEYTQVNGKGPHYVCYKLKVKATLW